MTPASDYVKLVEREESALFVSLISRGFQAHHFLKSLDWQYGVVHHRYRDRGHYISAQDRLAVREVILKSHAKKDDFWDDYIRRCGSAGAALLSTAESLGGRDWGSVSHQDLRDGFAEFAEATMDMVPFLMATIAVQPVLERELTEAIASELPPLGNEETARQLLPKLLAPSAEPDAVKEIRNAQKLADEARAHPALVRLIQERDSLADVRQSIRDVSPSFLSAATAHIDDFGWLRTHGYRFDPLTFEELLERVAGMLERQDDQALDQPKASRQSFDAPIALGFEPSPSLSRLIDQLAELIHLRFYRIDVHLQADCAARPLFTAIAEHLGCTREEMIFASVDELENSLSTEAPLDKDELRQRATQWFELIRDDDILDLHSLTASSRAELRSKSSGKAELVGMTAARGRASGSAKVLFGAGEVHKVARGDILVTTMTTPDLMLAIENSAAIVTDEGGILSHAAIISRELGIPCVIGTERATRLFGDGDILEVDAMQADGSVRRIGEAY